MPILNKIRLLMVVQQYLMDSFSWTGKSPLLKYNASSSDTYYTTMKIASVANSAIFQKIKGGSTLYIFQDIAIINTIWPFFKIVKVVHSVEMSYKFSI